MPQTVRRPSSVSFVGFLLMGEGILLVVAGIWSANMNGHDIEPTAFIAPVLAVPIALAIVGKLVLNGARAGRIAYWLLVLGCIGAMGWAGTAKALWWALAVFDFLVGIFLFRSPANAFFAGRDYRHRFAPEVEEEREPEVKITTAPRISPRGSGPGS